MNDIQAESRSFSLRAYTVTFIILAVLLLLTVLAAQYHLGATSTLISLTIAAVKAFLVALVFMHIRLSSKATWVFAAAGLLWLAILFTFSASDYLSRGWYSRPPAYTPADAALPAPRLSVPSPPGTHDVP